MPLTGNNPPPPQKNLHIPDSHHYTQNFYAFSYS